MSRSSRNNGRLGALIVALMLTVSANAQVSNYKAYTLFIYNFTKYVVWPEGEVGAEFVIGVYGKSPITDELAKMGALKKVGDKSIKVLEMDQSTISSAVQILFIPEDKSNQINNVISSLKGRPVLVVAEKEGLINKGACISFLTDQSNLRFELNSVSLTDQKLKVSKALESLAFRRI